MVRYMHAAHLVKGLGLPLGAEHGGILDGHAGGAVCEGEQEQLRASSPKPTATRGAQTQQKTARLTLVLFTT